MSFAAYGEANDRHGKMPGLRLIIPKYQTGHLNNRKGIDHVLCGICPDQRAAAHDGSLCGAVRAQSAQETELAMSDQIEPTIVLNTGVPPLDSPEFDDFLHRWHAHHNHAAQAMPSRGPIYVPVSVVPEPQYSITTAGREALAGQPQTEGVPA